MNDGLPGRNTPYLQIKAKKVAMPDLSDFLDDPRPDALHSVADLLDAVRRDGIAYHPSPVDWRDEVLYFLLPDRFSDGK
jgi:hypothetical protein